MNPKGNPIITYEFGTLFIDGQAHKEGDTPLRASTFNNLWNFILSNKNSDDTDVIMSVHTRGGRKYIKTGRYVGTVQTKDGQIIEILPKIYKASGKQEEDQNVCRTVFLNMLRHFADIQACSFQNASLSTKGGFPILEVYISNYIHAVESLMLSGLKKNYSLCTENQRFLKGKLNISKQITQNITNKAKFSIEYNKYIEDIPQNRIIVTTLRKLFNDSHSTTNKAHISTLLTVLSNIPSSSNIENDLRISNVSNRLFASYDLVIKWSTQFLLNNGFTTFAGSCVNQSLLFQVEKLFEDFIAFLFKKYAPKYKVDAQNTKYFLVDKHNGKGMFRLRPDIFVETDPENPNYECIIIDTKWKAIDETRPDKNYLIDIKDMYQLYAYGQKYRQGQSKKMDSDVTPKLVLIYPYSEKFTQKLPEFIYEDIKNTLGLSIMVVPFDLSDASTYKQKIHNIIHCLDVKRNIQPVYKYEYDWEDTRLPMVAESFEPFYNVANRTMLVGCYKDKTHLNWILGNHLYNIRIGNRHRSIDSSGTVVSASRLLLYNLKNPSDYKIYNLDSSKQVYASNKKMEDLQYPGLKNGREYILYIVGEEIDVKTSFDVKAIKESTVPKLRNGAPFYVNY